MEDATQPELRRTRFVCISDTHNASPADGAFKLPAGDVLIHAGDLTRQGTLAELRKTVQWIAAADFEVKIVVAGNHDVTLDRAFYAEHGANFHNQHPQDPNACLQLLRSTPSLIYLDHEAIDVRLARPDGPRTRFKVFGSPRSPAAASTGRPWAFQYPPSSAASGTANGGAGWDATPLDADVVVTHTPPAQHCDTNERAEARGCEALRRALWRVRPMLAVCGHVHAARGAELVRWDLGAPHVRFKEYDTGHWADPSEGTKKMAYIDLSSRGGQPLQSVSARVLATQDAGEEKWPEPPVRYPGPGLRSAFKFRDEQPVDSSSKGPVMNTSLDMEAPVGRLGLGGDPPSLRSDVEALKGRLGRRETCVVNAAIMASSWPYPKGIGARRWNKPVVVDIDLPVASGADDLDDLDAGSCGETFASAQAAAFGGDSSTLAVSHDSAV